MRPTEIGDIDNSMFLYAGVYYFRPPDQFDLCAASVAFIRPLLGIQWSLLPAIKYWRRGTFRLDVDCVMERRPLRRCVIRHRWPTTKQVDSYSNTEATAQTLHDSTEPGMYLAIGAKLRFPMYNRSQDTR